MSAGVLDISVCYRTISVESPIFPGTAVVFRAIVQLVKVCPAQPEFVPASVSAVGIEGIIVEIAFLREQKSCLQCWPQGVHC